MASAPRQRDRVPDIAAGAPQIYGRELARAAIARVVPLRDFVAGERLLRVTYPQLSLNDLVTGRGIAISLIEDAARHPDARPVRALRAAADLAERALTHARTEDDHLVAWRRMTELLDDALAGVVA